MELVQDAEAKVETHPGCVKRDLTVRDRMLIFQALGQGLQQGGSPQALSRLRELIDSDGVEDYYEAVDKDYAMAMNAYAESFRKYVADPVKNQDPGPRPKQTNSVKIGPTNTYWVKAKLDTHICDALKAAKFDAMSAEYVVSLFAKYGIAIEE